MTAARVDSEGPTKNSDTILMIPTGFSTFMAGLHIVWNGWCRVKKHGHLMMCLV